jgi:hypothetical protein
MKFQTTIIGGDTKNTTGIEVPPDVVEALGSGKRPPVKVTVNGHTYRSTVAVMGGKYLISVSAEQRANTGVNAGDNVEVTLELDTEPRIVELPEDFAAALEQEPQAKAFFETLSPSNKGRHVLLINDAKTPETRQRRIDKAIETLIAGKK